ncbi:MAG: cytoskeletal protein CcmA (bactofilin family) [Polaribacter sp.]|jgi:cytoskeletal protein CcmA (bactofilin family)
MFSKKSNTATATTATTATATPSASDSCVIADGTVIEGMIKCSKGIRLDGKVVGDVFCDQRFVMGDKGMVEGAVKCNESVISGNIHGEISVKGLLHLLGSAFIKGKIMASKMIVDEGAKYSGECLIGEQGK